MKISELAENSRQNLRKNGLIAIVIMFFCGLICGAAMLINLLFVDLFILIVPFIILPTMFAFQRAIIILRSEETLTFSMVFSGYGQYFSPRFNSTYSVLKNLLWLVIVYFGTTFITSIVVNLYFYAIDFMGFRDIINQIIESGLSYEAIENVYTENAYFFSIYNMANSLPPLLAATVMGFYFFSTTGHSFFLRVSGVKYSGRYIKDLFIRTIRRHRGEFLKYYLALNWPMYVLFIGGLALGGFVGSAFRFDYGSIFSFATAFAIFLSFGIYGAVYFANKEAIYNAMMDNIQKEDEVFKEEIKRTIEQFAGSIDASILIDETNPENDEEQKNDSDES